MKMTVFWDVVIIPMMEAVSTSEMLVNFYQTTRRNIPEDSLLHEPSSLQRSIG
jgi:sorbitol-specific phosphotransferase system component IIA